MRLKKYIIIQPLFFILILVAVQILGLKKSYPFNIMDQAKEEAQQIFSGVGYVRGYEDEGCEWELPPQVEGKIKFGSSTIFYFKCLHGAYNAWYVFLEYQADSNFKPFIFPYPDIISDDKLSQNHLEIVGISHTYSLCNPSYNFEDGTISTMCKGRGIGDVATYGEWKLKIKTLETWISEKPKKDFKEFQLIKFAADFTLDQKKNPVLLLDFQSNQSNK